MKRIIYIATLYFWILNCLAWNAQGHQVIAQIAYDNLTPAAKETCHKYLYWDAKESFNAEFIAAATWLDQIKLKNVHWYDTFHYIDIPFSNDGSVLPPIETTNAVWGIKNAISILSTNKKVTAADKRFALFILIHLVGDIHQPLHAVTKVSHELPEGDRGGNLFPLGENDIANNLHQYWDNGAGFFTEHYELSQIENKARLLEKKWPCSLIKTQENLDQWAKESHRLAVNQAYQINPKEIPSPQYQLSTQKVIQKQTVIAGCRLAALLNGTIKNYH